MGGIGIIFNGLRSAYRYIRYGSQIGKTAENGARVYKRGTTITGLDANGGIIRRITSKKSGPFSTTTESYARIPYSNDYNYSKRITTPTEKDVHHFIFRCRKSPDGRQSDVYNTPTFIEYTKNHKTGKVDGYKDIILRDEYGTNVYGQRINFSR